MTKSANILSIVGLAGLVSLSAMALSAPASAMPIGQSAAGLAGAAPTLVETVGHRYGHGYYGHGYYGRRGGYDAGAAAAAGVAGLAAGALIAGAIANQQAAQTPVVIDDPEWEARCYRKYRSFDRTTGTYLGRDGIRRYCE